MAEVKNYKVTSEMVTCKKCGYVINGALGDNGEGPKKGDFSVCGKCATIGRYNEDFSVTPMSEGALEIMSEADPEGYEEIQKIVGIIKKLAMKFKI